ncbi:MAG: DNA-directed RNA polymerase omega subunit [Firmicutes bacterium]|nr:DNA-directed RNA polymerase omega subunit [Bacillota bacterium]MDI6705469.1 DNA-directed RNA polymerase subunit omega [Bacillota bacterium]
MLYPSMKSLLKKVDSRYTLVVLAAKRARQLTENSDRFDEMENKKPVTRAIEEISEGKVKYVRTRDGIK